MCTLWHNVQPFAFEGIFMLYLFLFHIESRTTRNNAYMNLKKKRVKYNKKSEE